MGYFARRKASKEARQEQEARLRALLRESYAHPITGLDPAATALLYTTVASADVEHDEDVEPMADDTGREESAIDNHVAQD